MDWKAKRCSKIDEDKSKMEQLEWVPSGQIGAFGVSKKSSDDKGYIKFKKSVAHSE